MDRSGARRAPRLAVNVDHIATIRQARGGREPDPVVAAVLAELAGAEGIIVHLREDRRHIQDRDLRLLRETVRTRLNLEMAATDEMVGIAVAARPDLVTLVPERRQELTTEGGLEVVGQRARLTAVVGRLDGAGIPVSLFIAPEEAQVEAAKAVGASLVELHTGRYAEGRGEAGREALAALIRAARFAAGAGLSVSAGHGLTYENVEPVAAIPEVEELNIGHSIVARAALVGMERAVREMVERIRGARG
ncbi:MAG TPA: pyridoxine 5'-phosphate synthase [Candidatus Methylomirabilis sp.]|jgi:pyridoxine 5-phosphate synthase|nr:pyridoxine 5'-phosphate synthase [Candidatus Methylomirabilis sp.]